jgi:hypothetical protein
MAAAAAMVAAGAAAVAAIRAVAAAAATRAAAVAAAIRAVAAAAAAMAATAPEAVAAAAAVTAGTSRPIKLPLSGSHNVSRVWKESLDASGLCGYADRSAADSSLPRVLLKCYFDRLPIMSLFS